MLITWICRNCQEELAHLRADDEDPRVLSLTSQVDGDIIDYNRDGSLVVRLLCESCREETDTDESGPVFIWGTFLH